MYVDLHTHLMPGVDDGSPDMKTSLEAIAKLGQAGVSQIAVTPHVNSFFDHLAPAELYAVVEEMGWGRGGADPLAFIPQGFAELSQAAEGLGVVLHQGGELSPEVACQLSARQLSCIALGPQGNQFILMEVSLYEPFDESWSEAADHLRLHGYDILLAHPERAPNMHSSQAQQLLVEEIGKGVKLQVNLSSLSSARVGSLACSLIERELAWCVASDFHPPSRPGDLSTLPERLSISGLNPELALLLGCERPAALLSFGF